MKKRITVLQFPQFIAGGIIIEADAVAGLPDPIREQAVPVTMVNLLSAALDTPLEGRGGLLVSEQRARSRIADALDGVEDGAEFLDLTPQDFTLLKTCFQATQWRQRHAIFTDIDDALEAATDVREEPKSDEADKEA